MIKGSEARQAAHPIDTLFLDRWSPRAMTGEPIDERELLVLFEAAHWAPSSGNSQPWRFLYARRETEHWPLFFDLLVEGNRTWCHKAAALIVFISRNDPRPDGTDARHAFLRHRISLDEFRPARLAPRAGRPRHGRLRLRARPNGAATCPTT